jgi:hypothetical protein
LTRFARARFVPADFARTRLRGFALPDFVDRRDAIALHLFASSGKLFEANLRGK